MIRAVLCGLMRHVLPCLEASIFQSSICKNPFFHQSAFQHVLGTSEAPQTPETMTNPEAFSNSNSTLLLSRFNPEPAALFGWSSKQLQTRSFRLISTSRMGGKNVISVILTGARQAVLIYSLFISISKSWDFDTQQSLVFTQNGAIKNHL